MGIYTFYIQLEDGQKITWSGLTQRQAMAMHRMTMNNISLNDAIRGYGWSQS